MTSDEKLRSYVARIEKLESEIADLNGDKSDVYTEAKGNGFDVPALKALISERRRASKDPVKFEDLQNWIDVYRNTLESGTVVATRARAKRPTKITETDRAATSSAPEAASGKGDPAAADPIPPSSAAAAPVASPLPLAGVGAFPPAALDTADDHDWERRDGAATYDGVRQIQRDTLVASGAARLHPAEIDMPEIPDWLRRA